MTTERQEITMKNGDYLIIKTPTGEITIFHGKVHRTMTCYAKNLEILAFYDEAPTKQTRKPFMDGAPRLVCLTLKED